MANLQNLPFLLILSSFFAVVCNPCLALQEDRKVYIVYLGALPKQQLDQVSIQSRQLSLLQNVLQGSLAEDRLVQSYKRSFNGFAASLTEEEQQKIARMEGVVSVFPSKTYQLHTTESWHFIGFSEPVKRDLERESDVIVGILDTGIWPESASFSDKGFGPPPKKWKGICQTEGNFTCNNKLIGARYYEDPLTKDSSVRDTEGHGTHTASTAAGRKVKGVSFFGLAPGNARGAVPSARIAMYKVCGVNGCQESSILSGFDDAIADGVDIISVSLGSADASKYSSDSIAIGAFQAMLRGILTSQSGGNLGPVGGSIVSVAPWVFSVAASSIDRHIITKAIVGDNTVFEGLSINTFNSTEFVPLIHSANASSSSCDPQDAGACSSACLVEKLVKGKIIFCDQLYESNAALSFGAKGQITKDEFNDYSSIFPLPATRLSLSDAEKIKSYISKTKKPMAKILKSESLDWKAPVVVSFSSRGPNPISSNILKPDISAPGVDIIAAFSPSASITYALQDKRSAKYAILSGTSMACPHVSGAAAYVKEFHPEWSPAAIKSALMTTAFPMNSSSNPEAEFAYGAGQINPVKAINPGLVYDINKEDYLQFLCHEGYSEKEIRTISGETVKCSNKTTGTAGDLNYPSIQLLVKRNKSFSRKFTRTVTNVGASVSTYKAIVKQHPDLQVTVNPSVLSFKSLNEKHSFVVTVTGKGLPTGTSILSTQLVWSDGVHSVRSPIVVYTTSNP